MRWIIIFLGALVTFAGATTWRLPAYRTCGTLDLSRAMEKPFVTGAGMAYQSDENLIWITSGSVLYKISYWDGEVLSTHELRKTGRPLYYYAFIEFCQTTMRRALDGLITSRNAEAKKVCIQSDSICGIADFHHL